MIKTTQPALHGDQHCPDGSDPIPCLITAPADFDTYPDAVLAHPCLTHYWPADEASGNLLDRKGSADLVPVTAVALSATYPQYGAAGPFSELPELTAVVTAGVYGVAPDDHDVFVKTSGVTFAAGDFTVETWIYCTSYDPGSTGVFNSTVLAAAADISLVLFNRKLQGAFSAALVDDPTDLPLNTWHYVVLRRQGTTLALFRNGNLLDTATTGTGSSSGGMSWLNNSTGPSYTPWNGRGAQLAFYNCALTDDEIAQHYELRDTGTSGAPGLVLQTDGEGGTTWDTVGTDSITDDAITAAKIAAGAVGSSELASTTVTAGNYGDATHVGTFTVDADGRLTAAASVAITGSPTGTAGGALDGTYPNPGLAGSVAGAGLSETSDVLSVNVDGSTLEISTDTLRVKAAGITANELASTTVTPGTYGDATHVGQFTVDADGRITAASSVTVTGGSGGTSQHILLADGHGTPFTFNDMLQMDDGTDFMWNDPE